MSRHFSNANTRSTEEPRTHHKRPECSPSYSEIEIFWRGNHTVEESKYLPDSSQ